MEPPTLGEAEDLASASRKWTRTIYATAFGLPLVGLAGEIIRVNVRPIPDHIRAQVLHDLPAWIGLYPVLMVFTAWPFWLLKRAIVRRLPYDSDMAWAGVPSLIGLSSPYLLAYCVMPFEMTSGAPDAGQGVGMFLAFAPVPGGALAIVGWWLGRIAWVLFGRKSAEA